MKKLYFITLVGLFFVGKGLIYAQQNLYEWPKVNKESKTWTRWWWMGSAVDKKNITRSLIAFEKAGIGGVEIEPIYGVKGQEEAPTTVKACKCVGTPWPIENRLAVEAYWVEARGHHRTIPFPLEFVVELDETSLDHEHHVHVDNVVQKKNDEHDACFSRK